MTSELRAMGPRPTRRWVEGLRDLAAILLPGRCLGCAARVPPDSTVRLVCGRCRGRMGDPPWPRCPRCHLPRGTGRTDEPDCLACRAWPPAIRAARWAVALAPPADALVHGLKYEGWRDLAPYMASRMAGVDARSALPDGDHVVVPVPTTTARRRSRGYNQAALLAEHLAGRWRRPVIDALVRREGGATQVALHPDERRANVADAFAPGPDAPRVRGRGIVLVDDVLTTGATAAAAATALERAGATGVVIVTFARALPGRSAEAWAVPRDERGG